MIDFFDWEAFRAMPLSREPYEHVIVDGFVKPEGLAKINADYPAIEDTGSFPVEGLQFGPGFQSMVDALESETFRKAFEEKFQVDLSGRPTTITVRGRCAGGDGQIHTDSVGKIITILIYLNPVWDNSGGRLRLLRAKNIEEVAAEVVPSGGNLVAFLRSDHSWHGHLPFSGERRVIQFNWVVNKRNQTVVLLRHRLSASVKRLLRTAKPSKAQRQD
jgi:SM-20-related protein